MSNTPTKQNPKEDETLPQPVGEDGVVRDDDDSRAGQEKAEDVDTGLTDIGAGRPNERKII